MGVETVEPAEISCVCARLRMTTRAVTRVYDDALRPIGLRTTQFSLLARLDEEGPSALTRLARRLALDRTSLARELEPLVERGLVEVVPGEDRRTRIAALTEAGRERLDVAYPLWRAVQRDVRERYGRERVDALLGELGALARTASTG
jgi:DNA-binding MarR family transcriptional regulator